MKKKLLAISMLVIAFVLLFAGCGSGVPGFLKNPPATVEEMVDAFETEGWEVLGDEDIMGMGLVHMVMAMKTTPDFLLDMEEEFEEEEITLAPTDKVTLEMAMVMYFAFEEFARESYNDSRSEINVEMRELRRELPKGISLKYDYRRSGRVISLYANISGNWSAFNSDDWDFEDVIADIFI